MFVPHNPDMIFDVKKSTDRCVCGCSAVITCNNPSSINYGYCKDCAEKREEFVNKVTGRVLLGKECRSSLYELNIIENLRQSMFKEIFYYMVDKYFGEHQNDGEFTEPYQDEFFLAKVYREKNKMMNNFLSNIEEKSNLWNDTYRAFTHYKLKLEEMHEKDIDMLDKIGDKISERSYKKIPE